MLFKVEFKNYPQMEACFEKECGYTIEEVERIAIKRMIPGMNAKIFLANELVKEIGKWKNILKGNRI